MAAGSHWREESDPAVQPAGLGTAPPVATAAPNDDPFWGTWRGIVPLVAVGCGSFGWIAILSIGLLFLAAAHLLLGAAIWLYQGPRSERARLAGCLLLLVWWPITLLASAGAAPVLLAWAAYRRILARRGEAWNGPAWPRQVIVAAAAAGTTVVAVLALLLFI